MAKLLDLGDLFFVKERISGMQLMTEMEDKYTIRVFMVGVTNGFDINYPSEEKRNEAFKEFKKLMSEND